MGIYVYRRDTDTGALEHLRSVPGIVNPAFLALDPSERFLYSVNETLDFDGEPTGLCRPSRSTRRPGCRDSSTGHTVAVAIPVTWLSRHRNGCAGRKVQPPSRTA